MTGTERERAKEAADVKAFYEILWANVTEETSNTGATKNVFHKAELTSGFEDVIKANRNSKSNKTPPSNQLQPKSM
jgi:hypothetical protein